MCAKTFWSCPNDDTHHLIGWLQDPSMFESLVMPDSIKLRGSFEHMGCLGIQLQRLSDETLQKWKSNWRSVLITYYQDTAKTPLKGLAIKQATDLMVREITQAITTIKDAIIIADLVPEISGNKGLRTSTEQIAGHFKLQEWAPSEWGNPRFISAA